MQVVVFEQVLAGIGPDARAFHQWRPRSALAFWSLLTECALPVCLLVACLGFTPTSQICPQQACCISQCAAGVEQPTSSKVTQYMQFSHDHILQKLIKSEQCMQQWYSLQISRQQGSSLLGQSIGNFACTTAY